MPKQTPTKYVIVLPLDGAPYIMDTLDGKDDLKVLQKAVMGYIEPYDRKEFVIHPIFVEENPRWALAQTLLNSGKTKVYVNDAGARNCGPNMATIIKNPAMRIGGCPHLLGEIALVVPESVLNGLRIDPLALTLFKNPRTSDGNGNGYWEFGTGDEQEAFEKECETGGRDFSEHTGQCFVKKMRATVAA